MQGAREYAELFTTGQYGRLFICSSSHARGREFNMWVLPEAEQVPKGAYPSSHAVKVYGPVGGQLGWTEWYGWLHKGPWQEDFERLVAERRAAIAGAEERRQQEVAAKEKARAAQQAMVLDSYRPVACRRRPLDCRAKRGPQSRNGASTRAAISPAPMCPQRDARSVPTGTPLACRRCPVAEKMLQKDWRGRRVELLCDLRTKGGVEFKTGEVLVASSAYRGRLNLHDPATMRGNLITRAISRVNLMDVRLLPKDAHGVAVAGQQTIGEQTPMGESKP